MAKKTKKAPKTISKETNKSAALENVLAQIEKQSESLATELETTRRRVNALEHKMIPDLLETVKYITMKLDETERAGIIATMMIKASLEEAEKEELSAK